MLYPRRRFRDRANEVALPDRTSRHCDRALASNYPPSFLRHHVLPLPDPGDDERSRRLLRIRALCHQRVPLTGYALFFYLG